MSFYECRWCGQFVAFFFFNDTATTEIYTLSLHDALPISGSTHRVLMSCCSIFWSVDRGVASVPCDLVRVLRLPLSHMLLEAGAVEPPLGPESPGERPSAQCQREAVGREVQVHPASRRPSPRVRDELEALSLVVGDDAQQLAGG